MVSRKKNLRQTGTDFHEVNIKLLNHVNDFIIRILVIKHNLICSRRITHSHSTLRNKINNSIQ